MSKKWQQQRAVVLALAFLILSGSAPALTTGTVSGSSPCELQKPEKPPSPKKAKKPPKAKEPKKPKAKKPPKKVKPPPKPPWHK
jgi:hypothetical protein